MRCKEETGMKKGSTQYKSESGLTVGIDVGDKYCHLCVLDEDAEIMEESRVRTSREALTKRLAELEPSLVIMEVGTHSRWLSRLVEELGHTCLVANAQEARRLAGDRKNDKLDAETLARFGRADPLLLRPLTHRSETAAADLAMVHSRHTLVVARTMVINRVRGLVKAHGMRLPDCDARNFPERVGASVPESLKPAVQPLLETIASLTGKIQALDKQVEALAEERYPEARGLQQVPGIGPLTSLTFVLTLEDPFRFRSSRSVGTYLGLVPRQRQSGEQDPELGITKAGDAYLRYLLVQCAHYITGFHGPDSDLRRWALKRDGGKNAKKRTVVAVARKLAVLLHRLWVTGEVYEPLRGEAQQEVPAA
jgi:transposase